MRAARLLEKMSLDEKLTLMHGELGDAYDVNQAGHVCGIPRLGIPEVFIADGEYGVDILWETTALPAKVSLAATFDEKSAYEYGSVLGRESKDTGIHMVLSTRVNIARDPIAQIGQSNGGNFQTLGEDPLLNGVLGCAEVKGIQQDNNALANVKHFFGSSTGTAQGAGNSVMDEQTAFDLYLLPFEMVIRAGAATLMSSYNQVNGVWTYRHTDILRKFVSERWGFHGIMVCDWCCLYSSAAAAGGVTLEMPEENYYGKKLRQAIRTPDSGVTEADIDQCVLRYLDTLDRFGMLDEKRIPGSLSVETKAAHIPIARRLASRGAVLLKNENQILPLNAARDQIVFIGPTAAAVAMPVFKEGSYGFSDRKQSPLEAMRELSGRAIAFEQGTDMEGELIPATNWQDLQHTRIRYETDPMNDRDLKTLPTPLQVFEIDEQLSFQDESTLPALGGPDEYYMFNGFITAEETGWHRLSLQVEIPTLADHDKNGITNKDMFCFTSGNLYIKEESTYRCIGIGTRTAMNGGIVPNSDVVPCRDGWNNAAGFVYLEAGRKYEIAATATNLYRGPVSARLCWSKPSYRAECRKRAVEAAAKADVAVVFVWHKSPSDAMEL